MPASGWWLANGEFLTQWIGTSSDDCAENVFDIPGINYPELTLYCCFKGRIMVFQNGSSTTKYRNHSLAWRGIQLLSRVPKRILMALISGYRYFISPLTPPSCRFTPTCSEYALVAINRFGFWFGGYLACRRLIKCVPGGDCGLDPVPNPTDSPTGSPTNNPTDLSKSKHES